MKTLKYAWRFLIRSKSYTIINLLGLAFSLACCMILVRYIHRELTVDNNIIHTYTSGFAVKAPITIGIFIIGLVIVTVISLGTLLWQVRKAANINPAEIMKYE